MAWRGGGSGSGGSGTVTSFSAGTLSPLFTTSVGTPTTTPALSFALTNAAGGTVFGNNTGASAAPAYTAVPILGIAGTTKGTLGLAGNTSGIITIQPQAAAGTYNFNLPTTSGAAGQILTSGGGGAAAMTWTNPSSTSPAGVDGDVQFNNSGAFGADPSGNFSYDLGGGYLNVPTGFRIMSVFFAEETATASVLIGSGSDASAGTANQSTFIGSNAGISATDKENVAIGYFSDINGAFHNSIALGARTIVNASNQCAIGGNTSGTYVDTLIFGHGSQIDTTDLVDVYFSPTAMSGVANQTGINLHIRSGASTGNAKAVDIIFEGTPSGLSGSTTNTYAEFCRFLGNGGSFQWKGLTGATVVNINSSGQFTSGEWRGTIVSGQFGGTGINNGSSTITLGGNLTTTGAFNTTFSASGSFTYTLPTATSTLLANNLGLSGGSTLVGGTAASETLTLSSTSNATKGKILFGTSAYDEVNNRLGIGQTTPTAALHIKAGTASASTAPIKLTTGTSLTVAEAGAFEYTTPQLFFTNGGAQRQEIPQIQQSRVTSTFSKTSDTALAAITGLTATVVAGKIYRFEATLFVTAGALGGTKFDLGGTATATAIILEILMVDNTSNLNTITSKQTALAASVGQTGTTDGFVKIAGLITVNAAGTLTPRFAQNASNGTASNVLVGSTFQTTEIA